MVAVAGVARAAAGHVVLHGGRDLGVRRAGRSRDARAFARGVRQHLPGLIGPAELEDADTETSRMSGA